jgi:pyridoxine/pyridoxamine 5'-phosphate oxidase
LFFWKEIERQVRISGVVEKLSDAENDEYFNSRPEGSRIGAWASPQSEVIENREWLEERKLKFEKQFSNTPIVRPPHWVDIMLNRTPSNSGRAAQAACMTGFSTHYKALERGKL